MSFKKFNLSILGPPGSGKGTQAGLLEKDFGLAHIETGDILRERAEVGDAVGKKIEQIMLAGKLVPTPMLMEIMEDKIKSVAPEQGIIFDGTPRAVSQVSTLEKLLLKYNRQLDYLIFLNVGKKEIINRLSKRRVCLQCDHSFILGVDLKIKDRQCSLCGGKIYRRDDDIPESIEKRWQTFVNETEEVIEYYRRIDKMIEINGEQTIEQVHQEIIQKLALA